jgi:peptide/nickel transport system substrate-binding protein
MRSGRHSWWSLAALAFSLAAAGCGRPGGATGTYHDPHPLPQDTLTYALDEVGTHGGRFVLAQTSSPRTFNVAMSNETSSQDICSGRLFTSLIDFDAVNQVLIPALAKSWETSPDGLTWTFHLRRGAAFSDGHPLTADDVLFSFEVYMDDSVRTSMHDFFILKGQKFKVSAPDSYTVVVQIAAPYAMLEAVVGSVYILPKHVLQPAFRAGRYSAAYHVSTRPESLVTSGPWKLKEYVPNEKTVLTRNPYWIGVDAKGQRLPYLDELVFLIVPDQNTAALKFNAGEVDALDDVKPENYQTYANDQQKGNFTFYELGPALNTNFCWFNLNRVRDGKQGKTIGSLYVDPVKYAWFKERDFRRAVSKAIDRDAMIKSVFYGQAVKNWSTSTPGNKIWYTPEVVRDDYDPEGAKKLLAGLGWKDGNGDGVIEDLQGNPISFTLQTNSSNLLRVGMANFIKDDLAKVGIKVTPLPVEFNTLITHIRQDFQYEACMLGLASGVPPDPGMSQNVYRSSGLTHYWNILQPRPETEAEAKIDALTTQMVATNDLEARKKSFVEMQNLVNQECFVIWLPSLIYKVPIRNKFGNIHPTVIPHRIIWNIDRVFMKRGKPAA